MSQKNWLRLRSMVISFVIALFASFTKPPVTPHYYLFSIVGDLVPYACLLFILVVAVRVVVTGVWLQKLFAAPFLLFVGIGIVGEAGRIAHQYYGGWYAEVLGP